MTTGTTKAVIVVVDVGVAVPDPPSQLPLDRFRRRLLHRRRRRRRRLSHLMNINSILLRGDYRSAVDVAASDRADPLDRPTLRRRHPGYYARAATRRRTREA